MKTALVTGGAHRIGKQICRALHQQQFNLIIHYHHSQDAAQALADELNAQRQNSASILQADLRKLEDLEHLSQQVGSLDLLVNNASVFYPTAVKEMNLENYDEIMNTNLRAPLLLSSALTETLTTNQGCIINIVDIHAQRPLKNYPIYSISKAALSMMTQTLAKELAPAVRVCGVSPGSILWPENEAELSQAQQQGMLDKIALKKQGSPQDIANTVVFLAQSEYITGQILAVDGGRSLNQ